MVTIITTHLQHPEIPSGHRSKVSFSSPPTLEMIQNYVESFKKSESSSMFTYVIRILEDPFGLFILDNHYISTYAPFENRAVVYLEITWILKPNTYPAHFSDCGSAVNNDNINTDRMMPNTNISKQVLLPPEINSSGQHHGYVFHVANPNSAIDKSQLIPSNALLHGQDPKLSSSSDEDSSMFDDIGNLPGDIDEYPLSPNMVKLLRQLTEENPVSNLMEQASSSSDSGTSQSQSQSQSQSSRKRRNTRKADTINKNSEPCSKKSKQSSKRIIVPKNVCSITATFDSKQNTINENIQDYNASMVPLISHLNPDTVLSFERNINKLNRVEYLSNRTAVEEKVYEQDGDSQLEEEKPGRGIVPIQCDKTGHNHVEDQWLPLVKLPTAFMAEVAENDKAFIGVNVVKEYKINEREVGYHRVGNRSFLKKANTTQEIQVVQDIVFLTMGNSSNAKFELETYIIQQPNQLDKKVGPALFKISRSAAQGRNIGFKFGDGINLPRLAIYLFKKNDETGIYEPDWDTLCLSDYFHQDPPKK